ncbi:MAG: ricin-type beta-trefoil lectin domain protein, partial [Sulfurovum sp.]|nr:ricin-type beta-trefoil lectin domain protein [Sulfurovum sp.]
IEVAGDNDYFKIETTGKGLLIVYTTGSTDTYGYIVNPQGSVPNDDGGSGSNFKILRTVGAGTQYVRVRHCYTSLTGDYTLVSRFILPADNHGNNIVSETTVPGDDHGNNIASATSINPNSTTQGRINIAGDNDFFKIQIPGIGGTLTVKTTGSINTYGYLLDAEGRKIASSDGGGSSYNFKISRTVKDGTYYVQVRNSFFSLLGGYSLVSHFTPKEIRWEAQNPNTNAEPRISTRAFGGGCITKVGNYAKRQTCNDSNNNQSLTYTENYRLRDPLTNQCLMVRSHDNGSKIVFAPCQDDNQEQNFFYRRATRKFVHTTFSNKCLDIHGGNRTDLILWSCHGGVNQQFYIQPGTKQSNTDSSASQRSINMELHMFTRAFGGGCVTNVGGYAKKQSCSTSNTQQKLEYSNNHIKNPSNNKCLTVQSHDNGSKITYTQCQANSAAQTFSYNGTRKQFMHTASHKCLDVHGGNRTDLILWGCHGGVNQQFYIRQSNTGNATPPDSALRGSVSRGSSNMGLVGSNRARHIGR